MAIKEKNVNVKKKMCISGLITSFFLKGFIQVAKGYLMQKEDSMKQV